MMMMRMLRDQGSQTCVWWLSFCGPLLGRLFSSYSLAWKVVRLLLQVGLTCVRTRHWAGVFIFISYLYRNFYGLLFPPDKGASLIRLLIPKLLTALHPWCCWSNIRSLTDDVQMQLYLRKLLARAFIFSPFFMFIHSKFFYATCRKISQMCCCWQPNLASPGLSFLSISSCRATQAIDTLSDQCVREWKFISFHIKDVFYIFAPDNTRRDCFLLPTLFYAAAFLSWSILPLINRKSGIRADSLSSHCNPIPGTGEG